MDKSNLFIVGGSVHICHDMKCSLQSRLSIYILERLRIVLATRPVNVRGYDIRQPNNLMILAHGWTNSSLSKSAAEWQLVCHYISRDRYRTLDVDFNVIQVSSWMAEHLGLALVNGV